MQSPKARAERESFPEDIVGYRLLPGRFNLQFQRARRGMVAFAHRTWGDYHRFLKGKMLEPGERELYRIRLQSVGVEAVDRNVIVARRPLCIVTDRRVMAQDDGGHFIQVRRSEIRTARIGREDDPLTGPFYYVAVDRVDGSVHDRAGDVALYCSTRTDAQALLAALSPQ